MYGTIASELRFALGSDSTICALIDVSDLFIVSGVTQKVEAGLIPVGCRSDIVPIPFVEHAIRLELEIEITLFSVLKMVNNINI